MIYGFSAAQNISEHPVEFINGVGCVSSKHLHGALYTKPVTVPCLPEFVSFSDKKYEFVFFISGAQNRYRLRFLKSCEIEKIGVLTVIMIYIIIACIFRMGNYDSNSVIAYPLHKLLTLFSENGFIGIRIVLSGQSGSCQQR